MPKEGIYFGGIILTKILQLTLAAVSIVESHNKLIYYAQSENLNVYIGVVLLIFITTESIFHAHLYAAPPKQRKMVTAGILFTVLVGIICFAFELEILLKRDYIDEKDEHKLKYHPLNWILVTLILLVIVFQIISLLFAKKISKLAMNNIPLNEALNNGHALELEDWND